MICLILKPALCGSWLLNWPIASTSPSYYLQFLLALYCLKYYVTVFTPFTKHVYFALQITILQAMLQGLRNFSGLFFLLFQSSIGFLNFTNNMNMGYQTLESCLRCVIRHIEHQVCDAFCQSNIVVENQSTIKRITKQS